MIPILITIISAPYVILQILLQKSILLCIYAVTIYTLAHRFGIIRRLLHLWIEYEASRIANGAPISISHIEFRWINFTSLKSTITLYDAVVHTPQRMEWRWESPLIGRIGYMEVTCNLWSLLDLPLHIKEYFTIQMTSIKDIYRVEIRDVQVFIEKRRNVFNFHLLDERLDLPSAEDVMESLDCNREHKQKLKQKLNVNRGDDSVSQLDTTISTSKSNTSTSQNTKASSSSTSGDIGNGHGHGHGSNDNGSGSGSGSGSLQEEDYDDLEGAKKADELVKTIVGAVSSLGRAVNKGGKEGLSNALIMQKDGFVSHLKKVQTMVGLHNNENNESRVKNASIGIAKEGLQVMKQVGKVVEKNVLNMKEQVDALSKPPPFREDWKELENPDLFRFGYISIHDIRIFTKDIIVVPGSEQDKPSSSSSATLDNGEVKYQIMRTAGWSKPITIQEVKFHPSELGPSKDGMMDPANIGRPIEHTMDLVLERILTEMAASSLSGADVFEWFKIAGPGRDGGDDVASSFPYRGGGNTVPDSRAIQD